MLKIIDSQVRSLRKRQIVGSIKAGVRDGMYVGIWSEITTKDFPDAVLPASPHITRELATISTRLDALDDALQERLINWGYVMCDAGLRSYYLHKELRDAPPRPCRIPTDRLPSVAMEIPRALIEYFLLGSGDSAAATGLIDPDKNARADHVILAKSVESSR